MSLRALALTAAVLGVGCATPRPRPYVSVRETAAAATGCTTEDVVLVQDEQGWMAMGCGMVAAGSTPALAESSAPLTCAQLSRFDQRLRAQLAKKTGVTAPLAAAQPKTCRDTVALSTEH